MIAFGAVLLAALLAGLLAWLVGLIVSRLGGPGWLVTILSYATLVYAFWFFTSGGVIRIGQ